MQVKADVSAIAHRLSVIQIPFDAVDSFLTDSPIMRRAMADMRRMFAASPSVSERTTSSQVWRVTSRGQIEPQIGRTDRGRTPLLSDVESTSRSAP